MDMKFRYEKPILIDLREDISCTGHFMHQRNVRGPAALGIGYHRNGVMAGWQLLQFQPVRDRYEGRVVLQRQ